jgi:hypothetical protein
VSAVVTEALARAEVWDRAQTRLAKTRHGDGDWRAVLLAAGKAHEAHRAAQARLTPAEAHEYRTERERRRARIAANVS